MQSNYAPSFPLAKKAEWILRKSISNKKFYEIIGRRNMRKQGRRRTNICLYYMQLTPTPSLSPSKKSEWI